MTAKSSQKLANALRKEGFEELAKRAELDEFHDYLSPHDFPEMQLDVELVAMIKDESRPAEQRDAAQRIREAHHDGAWDATKEESDRWAASPEGQAALRMLVSK